MHGIAQGLNLLEGRLQGKIRSSLLFVPFTKTIHPKSEECLSEAMSRRVYDLKNDEELKAAYWEAARGGATGAAKV
jgi:hypothetical protein